MSQPNEIQFSVALRQILDNFCEYKANRPYGEDPDVTVDRFITEFINPELPERDFT